MVYCFLIYLIIEFLFLKHGRLRLGGIQVIIKRCDTENGAIFFLIKGFEFEF